MVVGGGPASCCREHGGDKGVAEAKKIVTFLLEDRVTDLGELVDMPPSAKESCRSAAFKPSYLAYSKDY